MTALTFATGERLISFLKTLCAWDTTSVLRENPNRIDAGWHCLESAIISVIGFCIAGIEVKLVIGKVIIIDNNEPKTLWDVCPHYFLRLGSGGDIWDASISVGALQGVFSINGDIACPSPIVVSKRPFEKHNAPAILTKSPNGLAAYYHPKSHLTICQVNEFLQNPNRTALGNWLAANFTNPQTILWKKAGTLASKIIIGENILIPTARIDAWRLVEHTPPANTRLAFNTFLKH